MPGQRATLMAMRMPHTSLIERGWSTLRAIGPQLEIVLLPGGLLILFVLLVVGRSKVLGSRSRSAPTEACMARRQ